MLAMPGTGQLGHLRENVMAGSLPLTDAETTPLDGVARGRRHRGGVR